MEEVGGTNKSGLIAVKRESNFLTTKKEPNAPQNEGSLFGDDPNSKVSDIVIEFNHFLEDADSRTPKELKAQTLDSEERTRDMRRNQTGCFNEGE